MTGSEFDVHTAPLFKKLRILDIFKQYEYQVGIFVHDALHNALPPHFNNYFSYVNHSHNTRRKAKRDLNIPKYNSNIGQSSIMFVGAKLWNNLPDVVRDIPARSKFKKDYKHFLLQKYSEL